MFSDTYSRIIKEALTEYHYQRYLHVFEYQHVVHAIPPPFNLPLLLIDIVNSLQYEWSIRTSLNVGVGSRHSAFIRPRSSEVPPGQSGGGGGGGTFTRKYVQRFLKSQAEGDLLSSAAQVGPASSHTSLPLSILQPSDSPPAACR